MTVDVGLHKATCVLNTPRFEDTMLNTSSSPSCPTWAFDTQRFSASENTISSASTSYNSSCLYNNASLSHLCEYENSDNVLQTLHRLDTQGFLVSHEIIFGLLQNFKDESDLHRAEQVYLLMVSSGLDLVATFGDHLVDLFVSFGSLQQALTIFRKIAQPSVRSWHLLISGCILREELSLAFGLFDQMQQDGVQPNDFIFTSILKVCGNLGDFEHGRLIHNQIIRQGLASNVFIGSTLIDMYAKCKCLDQARQVFDELVIRNVVAWNSMIGGYVKHGHGGSALKLFNEMQLEGIKPDRITFLLILKACSLVGITEQGILVHCHAIEGGLELNVQVGTSLVDMYAKCGNLKEACNNFQKLPCQDVVSWGAIVAGYIQHGDYLSGLELFDRMQEEGIKPDIVTLSSTIQACGHLGALKRGKQLHEQMVRSGQVDVVVVSSLIEMYASCGNLTEARQVLDNWPNSGVASWGAMIAGYAAHGNLSLASSNFEYMLRQGIMPNEVIYTSILDACSHAGQVNTGCEYFKGMKEKHGILPGIQHFGCMVDLFGRAGFFDEAEELLELMPIAPDLKSWMSLLNGCQKYRNVKLARHCFNQVVRLDPGATAGYVLMMQIYAHAHMWDNVKEIQELRRYCNAWKKPGRAWIEANTEVHEFVVNEQNHPMMDKVHNLLENLRKPMEVEGYIPEAELAFEADSMGEKVDTLFGHCEKLAIAFGLLTLPKGETIRVTKNLRMCRDCHTAGKVLAKIEQRHIIVRDEYCVHHFKDGMCSCEDNL